MNSIRNIISGFNFPDEFYAVEYHFGQTEDILFWSHLRLKKASVELLATGSGNLSTWEAEQRPLPVMLLLTGRKVLSKKLNVSEENISNEEILNRAFPSIDQQELITDVTLLKPGEYVASAIRQANVTEILSQWPEPFPVVDINLGLYYLWSLLIGLEYQHLHFGHHQIDVGKAEITLSDQRKASQISVFEQQLAAEIAPAFILGIFKIGAGVFEADWPAIRKNRDDWKYSHAYKKGLLFSAVFLLFSLLASFLFLGYYTDKVSELSVITQAYQKQAEELEELKTSYDQKKQFLQVNGIQNSKMSKMADDVALVLPDQISLSQMAIQPVERILKTEKLVRFSRNVLLIRGETKAYAYFQEWLGALKNLDWAESIEIAGYEETGNRHQANFRIVVKLKP